AVLRLLRRARPARCPRVDVLGRAAAASAHPRRPPRCAALEPHPAGDALRRTAILIAYPLATLRDTSTPIQGGMGMRFVSIVAALALIEYITILLLTGRAR